MINSCNYFHQHNTDCYIKTSSQPKISQALYQHIIKYTAWICDVARAPHYLSIGRTQWQHFYPSCTVFLLSLHIKEADASCIWSEKSLIIGPHAPVFLCSQNVWCSRHAALSHQTIDWYRKLCCETHIVCRIILCPLINVTEWSIPHVYSPLFLGAFLTEHGHNVHELLFLPWDMLMTNTIHLRGGWGGVLNIISLTASHLGRSQEIVKLDLSGVFIIITSSSWGLGDLITVFQPRGNTLHG